MTKRARKVVAGLEEGQWWLTTFFDYGEGDDSVEWDGDCCGEILPSDGVPNEEVAFKYLTRRYGGTVAYDRHTHFEYDETYLPVGT